MKGSIRGRIGGLLAAIAVMALPLVAAAQEWRTYGYTNVLTVVGVDGETGRIVVRDAWRGQLEISTDGDTRVQDATGTRIALAALEPWDRVVVDGRRELEGERLERLEGERQGEVMIADRVQLVIGTPGTPRSQEDLRRDAALRERIVERLAASRSLQGSDVWVSVSDGRVNLSGLVSGEAAERRALELARRTPGVREVTNDLREDPGLLEWARVQVKDEALARQVAERLVSEAFPGARMEEDWLFGWEIDGGSFEFEVDADMGTVTLRGDVPSLEDVERAIALARRTPGVRSVVSELDSD